MDETQKEKIVNMLRLAVKANAVALGRTAVERNIKKSSAFIIFAGKKDNNFMKKRADICKSKDIAISHLFNDKELTNIFGRQKLTLVAIVEKNFAKGINDMLDN